MNGRTNWTAQILHPSREQNKIDKKAIRKQRKANRTGSRSRYNSKLPRPFTFSYCFETQQLTIQFDWETLNEFGTAIV